MNIDMRILLSMDKYKDVVEDIIFKNGYISFENLDVLHEIFSQDVPLDISCKFRDRKFCTNLNTILKMRDTGFEVKYLGFTIGFNNITEIHLHPDEFDKFIFNYEKAIRENN